MLKFVLCAVLSAVVVLAQVEQCPTGLPTATSFEVVGCPEAPCGLINGTTANVVIGFDSPSNTNTLTASLNILWQNLVLEYDLGNQTNACDGIVGGCPLVAGNSYFLEAAVQVFSPFQQTEIVTLELNTADDSGNNVICGRLTTSIIV